MNRKLASVLQVLALLWALNACSSEPDPVSFTVNRVHDLLNLHRQAEQVSAGGRPAELLVSAEPEVHRTHAAGLLARPGTLVTFSGLATGTDARLSFLVGAQGDVEPAQARRPVTFRVELRRTPDLSAVAEDWAPFFERTLRFDELQPPPDRFVQAGMPPTALVEPHELALPGDTTGSWDLRFSTEMADGKPAGKDLDWPGWIEPRLLSSGRTLPREQHPVSWDAPDRDLLAQWQTARVETQHPDVPVSLAPMDAARGLPLVGGQRQALLMVPPSRVTWDLDLPPQSGLRLEVGMDTDAGWSLPGDGMGFGVLIDGRPIWRVISRAPSLQRDRRWQLHTLDLQRFGGRPVAISVVTDINLADGNDVGGFGRLELVRRHSVPRLTAAEAPSVIVILVDTLRSDALAAFGGAPDGDFHLDALACQGLSFVAARSSSSWTWPATASIFTGLHPQEHGLTDTRTSWLHDDFVTLAECFQWAGYTTGAFLANALIDVTSNLDQGFETFVNIPGATAATLNGRVASWLTETEGTARMLYVHLMDPHAPYAPPEPWLPAGSTDEHLDADHTAAVMAALASSGSQDPLVQRFLAAQIERYAAEVRYLDAAVGQLLESLREAGALDNALVVFTADHGEEFGEHQRLSHGSTLYDETLRVPLSITGFGPSALEPAVVQRGVNTLDLLPTLCELAGLPLPPGLSGRSLLPLDQAPKPQFAQTLHGFAPGVEGFVEKLSVTHQGYKLVSSPAEDRVELYHLLTDPGEQRDLSVSEPQTTAALVALLERWREQTRSTHDAGHLGDSEELIRRMQALGYIER